VLGQQQSEGEESVKTFFAFQIRKKISSKKIIFEKPSLSLPTNLPVRKCEESDFFASKLSLQSSQSISIL
jgi:hypothetical protein